MITELPVGKWTQDYKVFLESMMVGDEKKKVAEIKDFKENHTETSISFTITADKEKIDEFEKSKTGLLGKFKLTGSISTSNMHLFNTNGFITKYDAPQSIMKEFYGVRMDFYVKRKALLVEKLGVEQRKLSNKARFVEEVCSGELVVSNVKRNVLLHELKSRDYELFGKDTTSSSEDESDDEAETVESDSELAKGYEYLLGMKIWTLTYEKAEELRRQLEEKTHALAELEATEPSTIWVRDLDAIEEALNERDGEIAKAAAEENKARQKSAKSRNARAGKPKKRNNNEWDSEDEDHSSDEDMSDDSAALAPPKPVARVKPTAKRAAPAQKKAPVVAVNKPVAKKTVEALDSDSDDDMVEVSLSARLNSRLHVSPQGKAPAKVGQPKTSSLAGATAKSGVREVAASLDFDASDAEPAVAKKSKAVTSKPKPAQKRVVKAKKQDAFESESEESNSSFNSDSEDEVVVVPARSTTSRRTAAVKKTYTLSDDSDSDF